MSMDVRRRGDAAASINAQQNGDEKDTPALEDEKPKASSRRVTFPVGKTLTGASASLIFLCGVAYWSDHPKIWILRILTLLPVVTCFIRAATVRSWDQRLLPGAVVATTTFAQLPSVFGFGVAAACIVAFSLSTMPSPNQSTRQFKGSPSPVLLGTLVLVVVLLTENFLVWVVSATFEAGQSQRTAPPPLQDNGRNVIHMLVNGLKKHEVVGLRRLWNVQGALVACLGVSFILAEVYERRRLYSLGLRAVMTLAVARTIRTISFVTTVLPSQNKRCYMEHFPYPPPKEWADWLWVGILPSSNGGCNDLIISGHATVTCTLACISASISNDPVFCGALWTMVVLDYMVEIYEGFHYSVDMWLGLVLVCLLWRVLEVVEGQDQRSRNNIGDQGNRWSEDEVSRPTAMFASNNFFSRSTTVAIYSVPAVIAFVQLLILPPWTGNVLIVLYTIVGAVLYVGLSLRSKDPSRAAFYLHMAQHVVYTLLFMAIGIYL